jgi:hypothetical protein
MVLIGIITQWAVTGRGIHHQEREWTPSGFLHLFFVSLFCVTLFPSCQHSSFILAAVIYDLLA